MKVAISSMGKDIENQVSNVFGRCPYFVITEIENKKITKIEAIENISAKQMGRAGISAAQIRSSDVLRQFDIEVYNGSGLVKEVLQKFIDGKLEKIQ